MKTCPFCAEEIKDAAVVCKHCGRGLVTAAVTTRPQWATAMVLIGSVAALGNQAFFTVGVVAMLIGFTGFISGSMVIRLAGAVLATFALGTIGAMLSPFRP